MAAAHSAGLNRKQRKELARRLRVEDPGLSVMHPHAAGIDVGNSAHYVAVRPDRDPHSVRRFECFTADLHRLADWLQSCGVTTVAMQSTGVYWIPLYNPRRSGAGGLSGERATHQESSWAQERCAREPMAAEAPHLRPAPELVPPTHRDSRGADVLAPTRRSCARRQHLHPADAEGADPDEYPTGERHQRPERLDRAAHRPRNPRGRAGSGDARGTEPPRHSRHARHHRQKPRRDLAPTSCSYCNKKSRCTTRPATDRRVRSGARAASQGRRRQGGRPRPRRGAVPSGLSRGAAAGPKRRRKAAAMRRSLTGRELHRISGVDLTRIDGIDVGWPRPHQRSRCGHDALED